MLAQQYDVSIYNPATYAKSLANEDMTYIVIIATLGWINEESGDLHTPSARERPNTIGNDINVAITDFAGPAVIADDEAYNSAPSNQPNTQPFIALITSERRIPGFRIARLNGKEHAIVAIEGVRKLLEVSKKATRDEMLTVTVVSAASSRASRT